MKATLSRNAWVVLAALALTACPKKDETETGATATKPTAEATTATPAPTPSTAETTKVTPDVPPAKPGIEPRVKTELDGREPEAAYTGSPLAVAGAKASFVVPSAWKQGKSGAWATAIAADEKARFAAGAVGTGDDPAAKRTEATSALGLSDCDWATAETISLGKDKLSASAADGVCKRGGTTVHMASVTLAAENVVAVGGWDDGGDSAGVFGAFRSCKKTGAGGDATGIAACCSALQQNANSAPITQKGLYLSAAAACNAVRNDPRGRAALAGVRGMLMGAQVPAACR
ncbi:MAG: hypothetical protein HY744_13635 [Deltaproteobacteria bacterium]|nr:hypothetical protein [Deltaproteobacteria bacterium]